MPSNLFSLNSFPPVPDDGSPSEQIVQLYNYLYELREALNYILQNLDTNNWNPRALKKFTDGVQSNVASEIEKNINNSEIASKVQSISDTVGQIQTVLEHILPFIEELMLVVFVDGRGSITIGTGASEVHLRGDVLINDIPWTEGGG